MAREKSSLSIVSIVFGAFSAFKGDGKETVAAFKFGIKNGAVRAEVINTDDILQNVVSQQLPIHIRIALKQIFPEDAVFVFAVDGSVMDSAK